MAKEKERFEILLEEVRDGVKAVAEGHGVIRSEMRQMEERINEKLSIQDGKINYLAADLKNVKDDLKNVKDDLSEVKYRLEHVDHTLQEHVRLPAHA